MRDLFTGTTLDIAVHTLHVFDRDTQERLLSATVLIRDDPDNGGFVATCPALSLFDVARGETHAEALERAGVWVAAKARGMHP